MLSDFDGAERSEGRSLLLPWSGLVHRFLSEFSRQRADHVFHIHGVSVRVLDNHQHLPGTRRLFQGCGVGALAFGIGFEHVWGLARSRLYLRYGAIRWARRTTYESLRR